MYDQGEELKVFATEDAARAWIEENDPEGVAFEYLVIGTFAAIKEARWASGLQPPTPRPEEGGPSFFPAAGAVFRCAR
jgi:hypothetical protein